MPGIELAIMVLGGPPVGQPLDIERLKLRDPTCLSGGAVAGYARLTPPDPQRCASTTAEKATSLREALNNTAYSIRCR